MSERQEHEDPAPDVDRASLRADCESCFGLCCVVPAFSASADFAITKKAGQACPNLKPNFRCGIHTRLRGEGFRGCTVYDCFGAGQKVSQVTFGGADWQEAPRTAKQMFEVFPIMRDLHELLWYLAEALTLEPIGPLHAELRVAQEETEALTHLSPDGLTQLDLDSHRQVVNALPWPRASCCEPSSGTRGRSSEERTSSVPSCGVPISEAQACEGHTSSGLTSRVQT